MKDKLQKVIEHFAYHKSYLAQKQATIGFDGFIDCIVRVIKNKKDQSSFTLFQEMEEFGLYIISKKGKSCTFELMEYDNKIGGNMPILSLALGKLGVNVNCIGALGYPEIRKVFESMTENNCTLYSVAEPGYTEALEFHDGKIMLARMDSINDITWEMIKSGAGTDKIIAFFNQSDIIGLVNWSEVGNSNCIWEGIIHDILPFHISNKRQIMYFDLADCSKRYSQDINRAVELIQEFSRHFKVILSMNENESRLVYEALFPHVSYTDLIHVGDKIFNKIDIDILAIHPRDYSIAWDKDGRYQADNYYIDLPTISTGGGDNFNAGLCVAQLLEMDMLSSLILANGVAAFYVKYGYSPDQGQLIDFLMQWQAQIV